MKTNQLAIPGFKVSPEIHRACQKMRRIGKFTRRFVCSIPQRSFSALLIPNRQLLDMKQFIIQAQKALARMHGNIEATSSRPQLTIPVARSNLINE